MPAVVASAFGAVGSIGAAMYTVDMGLAPRSRTGLIAGIGVGLAAVATGVALLVRHHSNHMPDLPDPESVPTVPPAGPAPAGAPGKPDPLNTREGHLYGSWTETQTVSVPDSDGEGSHLETRTEHHTTSWDLVPRQQTGRLDGYATLEDALADTAQSDVTTIYRKQDGRIHAYVADPGGHWSRVDDITVDDPAVIAFVGDDGNRYYPNAGRQWGPNLQTPQDGLADVPMYAERIASWEMRNHRDPETYLTGRVSPESGYETYTDALGDLRARPGDQAIVEENGRFQVLSTATWGVDRRYELMGLRVIGDGDDVDALEIGGDAYVPAGGLWMTRDG